MLNFQCTVYIRYWDYLLIALYGGSIFLVNPGSVLIINQHQIPEFDNDLVRRLISTIKVESSEKLLIQFQSGIVMEQEIRYE